MHSHLGMAPRAVDGSGGVHAASVAWAGARSSVWRRQPAETAATGAPASIVVFASVGSRGRVEGAKCEKFSHLAPVPHLRCPICDPLVPRRDVDQRQPQTAQALRRGRTPAPRPPAARTTPPGQRRRAAPRPASPPSSRRAPRPARRRAAAATRQAASAPKSAAPPRPAPRPAAGHRARPTWPHPKAQRGRPTAFPAPTPPPPLRPGRRPPAPRGVRQNIELVRVDPAGVAVDRGVGDAGVIEQLVGGGHGFSLYLRWRLARPRPSE